MMAEALGEISIMKILQALAILIGAIIFLKIVNRLFLKTKDEKNVDRKRVLNTVRRFIEILTYSVVVVLVLWTFDFDVTGLIAGLGIGALVVGYALKDIIENWVSGFLIVTDKTFKIGDVISVGNIKGVVTQLSLRTTTLKTYDRKEVIIPNSILIKDRIINLTGGGKEAVTTLIFVIDYATNVELAKLIIKTVLLANKSVVFNEERKREIRFLVKFKEWAIEIEALFWINNAEYEEFIKSELTEQIMKKFAAEKIYPPLPAVMRKEYLEPVKQNETS
jgi:small-conductance mechanosensitive channel